ncbi:MAG: ATP-dependent Clp protease adaptor ClpS [SAR324 cluster bacterium]|nr:ATP-dependent Clp protease adaptor ClpS [SAR324 cluster bacterium]
MPFEPDNGEQNHSSTKEEINLSKPRQYKVMLHNDDYTPMDFVVDILINIFSKDKISAMQVMLNVHNLGRGVCGVYPFEIAETKTQRVHDLAAEFEYPLKASMEEE